MTGLFPGQAPPQSQTPAPAPSSDLVASKDAVVKYVPFQAKDAITLSVGAVMNYLCKPTRSGHVCTIRDATRFVMLCKARALNPWEGDAFIVGYDSNDGPEFNLITAVQAFFKRAEVHPNYDGHESGTIVRDASGALADRVGDFILDEDVLLGAWATVYLKNTKFPVKARIKFSTFSTGQARWKKDPAGMIVKCAEADALRRAFPTTLGGMYLGAEFGDGEVIDAKPIEPTKPPDSGRLSLKNGPTKAAPPKADPAPPPPETAAHDNDRTGLATPDEPPRTPDNPAIDEMAQVAGSTPLANQLRDSVFATLKDKLKKAKTMGEWETAKKEVEDSLDQLGEGNFEGLMQYADQRGQELLAAKAGKGKK